MCVDCLIYSRVLKLEHQQQQQHSSSSSTTTLIIIIIIIINIINEATKEKIESFWGFYFYIDSQIYLKFRIWEIISGKAENQDLSKNFIDEYSTIRQFDDWYIQPGVSGWIFKYVNSYHNPFWSKLIHFFKSSTWNTDWSFWSNKSVKNGYTGRFLGQNW